MEATLRFILLLNLVSERFQIICFWSRYNRIIFFAQGFDRIVELLLENGADLSIQNNEGDTPLHKAADNGKFYILYRKKNEF